MTETSPEQTDHILENVSKNGTGRRGRPRTSHRDFVENAGRRYMPEGCVRTKMNHVYGMLFLGAVRSATENTQKRIWGGTAVEIENGSHAFPKGYRTMAESAGRWIDAGGDAAEAVQIVRDARQRGISFGDLAKHFRSLRLGKKEGSVLSLLTVLCRAIDEYRKTFPKTTDQQCIGAAESLCGILEEQRAETTKTP